jgi:hypothetical protein
MKAVRYLVLVMSVICASSAMAAKHKRHAVPVTTATYLECEKTPVECPMIVDQYESCKAVSGKQNLEEGARDSDNAACMKMRLQKKICAKGWQSEKFKVTCR